MKSEEITWFAVIVISLESCWRFSNCIPVLATNDSFQPWIFFAASYTLCIWSVLLDLKNNFLFSSKNTKTFLSCLQSLDSLAAFFLGLGLYYKSTVLTVICVLITTKCFLLYLLSRMVTGQASFSDWDRIVQTTKTFLHPTGSFLFLADQRVIIVTAIWRCISMSSHVLIAYRGLHCNDLLHFFPYFIFFFFLMLDLIEKPTYNNIQWLISYSRLIILSVILVVCCCVPDIRRGFGEN